MRSLHLFALGLFLLPSLRAGPPFFTDDPEPVDLRHWEVYLFATGDPTSDGGAVAGPAAELNYGVLPDAHLHLVVPVARVSPSGGAAASGWGDIELGLEYRFVHESDATPQVAVVPMIELPTGRAARGLGNGRAWFRLPVWLQKNWGAWTLHGGVGAAFNSAPGRRNHLSGGWLVQRDFGSRLSLGGEIFSQGADAVDGRGFTAFNLGGSCRLTGRCSLLFSAGRSFRGERHTL